MFLHDVLGPQMRTSGRAPTSVLRVSLRTLDARIPSCAPVRAASLNTLRSAATSNH